VTARHGEPGQGLDAHLRRVLVRKHLAPPRAARRELPLTSSWASRPKIPAEFPVVFRESLRWVPGPSALLRGSYLPRRYFPRAPR